ncbi:MAG: HlyD family efflux transporter periplasmic adaptor subunit [Pseudomonadota bacterium]
MADKIRPSAQKAMAEKPAITAGTQIGGDSEDKRRAAALAALVQLEQRVRATSDVAELYFRIVNETALLIQYRHAALFCRHTPATPGGKLAALSNVPVIDQQAPMVAWLKNMHRHLDRSADATAVPLALTVDDVPPKLAKEWHEWQAPYALWLPLIARDKNQLVASVLLFRDQEWSEAEQRIVTILADAYGYSLAQLSQGKRGFSWVPRLRGKKSRKLTWGLIAAVIGLMLLPVRLSVLADVEVVPSDPYHIRAPLEGVIDEALVDPGDQVSAGQALLAYDERDLGNRLALGEQELNVAETELQRVSQAAVTDPRAKAQLATLTAQRDEKRTEVDYLRTLVERAAVTAPIAGVAIFDDADSLTGRPVQLGQRLMTVAAADEVSMELWLGTSDAIPLAVGAPVTLFLNVEPERPIPGALTRTGLLAEPRDNGISAYRLRAAFDDRLSPDERPALGLRGVAKLEGERVTLFYYLFRRPFSVLRQWFGV